MPEEPPRQRRLRAPSPRRFAAGALASFVAVFGVLALRMEGFHAGAMPFKAQWLLDRLSEVGRQHDVEVTWYRHEGKPVAILRFQPNQPRPAIKLKQVIVEQGKLTVSGESGGRRAVSQLP